MPPTTGGLRPTAAGRAAAAVAAVAPSAGGGGSPLPTSAAAAASAAASSAAFASSPASLAGSGKLTRAVGSRRRRRPEEPPATPPQPQPPPPGPGRRAAASASAGPAAPTVVFAHDVVVAVALAPPLAALAWHAGATTRALLGLGVTLFWGVASSDWLGDPASGGRETVMVLAWAIVFAVSLSLLAESVPAVRASLWNLLWVQSLVVALVLGGMWTALSFPWVWADSPHVARLMERLLFAVAPMPCAVVVVASLHWGLGPDAAAALSPFVTTGLAGLFTRPRPRSEVVFKSPALVWAAAPLSERLALLLPGKPDVAPRERILASRIEVGLHVAFATLLPGALHAALHRANLGAARQAAQGLAVGLGPFIVLDVASSQRLWTSWLGLRAPPPAAARSAVFLLWLSALLFAALATTTLGAALPSYLLFAGCALSAALLASRRAPQVSPGAVSTSGEAGGALPARRLAGAATAALLLLAWRALQRPPQAAPPAPSSAALVLASVALGWLLPDAHLSLDAATWRLTRSSAALPAPPLAHNAALVAAATLGVAASGAGAADAVCVMASGSVALLVGDAPGLHPNLVKLVFSGAMLLVAGACHSLPLLASALLLLVASVPAENAHQRRSLAAAVATLALVRLIPAPVFVGGDLRGGNGSGSAASILSRFASGVCLLSPALVDLVTPPAQTSFEVRLARGASAVAVGAAFVPARVAALGVLGAVVCAASAASPLATAAPGASPLASVLLAGAWAPPQPHRVPRGYGGRAAAAPQRLLALVALTPSLSAHEDVFAPMALLGLALGLAVLAAAPSPAWSAAVAAFCVAAESASLHAWSAAAAALPSAWEAASLATSLVSTLLVASGSLRARARGAAVVCALLATALQPLPAAAATFSVLVSTASFRARRRAGFPWTWRRQLPPSLEAAREVGAVHLACAAMALRVCFGRWEVHWGAGLLDVDWARPWFAPLAAWGLHRAAVASEQDALDAAVWCGFFLVATEALRSRSAMDVVLISAPFVLGLRTSSRLRSGTTTTWYTDPFVVAQLLVLAVSHSAFVQSAACWALFTHVWVPGDFLGRDLFLGGEAVWL